MKKFFAVCQKCFGAMLIVALCVGVAFAAINAYQFSAVSIMAPAVRASSDNATEVENSGYIGTAMFVVHAAAQGSGITSTIKLQHSTDNATWADVSGGAFTAVGNEASLQTKAISVEGLRQYIRAVDTVAGGSATGATSMLMIVRPKYQ